MDGSQAHSSPRPRTADSTSDDWRRRLAYLVDTMREMSLVADPQALVKAYGRRMRRIMGNDRFVSLSRRDLVYPSYRITRSNLFREEINPWSQRDRLPLLRGGILGELLYGEEPVLIDRLDVPADDPAEPFLRGMRSLLAVPHYDQGHALNMVVLMRRRPRAFDRRRLPEIVWMSNLFGRVTHNLVLGRQVQEAYEAVERELQVVADIQRSLLPATLPRIPTLEVAAHYQTSRHAGGDYYDFFEMPDGRWGIFIADVSGHGTPAAVIMAVTHSIAHAHHGPPTPPSRLLRFINDHLAARYTAGGGTFVTAFYGIYDPTDLTLSFCSAGHCTPRLRRDGAVRPIDASVCLPLGIDAGEAYEDARVQLCPGDAVVLYTDGITEARDAAHDLFGVERLDAALAAGGTEPAEAAARILRGVDEFCGHRAPGDDRTLLVLRVAP